MRGVGCPIGLLDTLIGGRMCRCSLVPMHLFLRLSTYGRWDGKMPHPAESDTLATYSGSQRYLVESSQQHFIRSSHLSRESSFVEC